MKNADCEIKSGKLKVIKLGYIEARERQLTSPANQEARILLKVIKG
jgi:hypothetical protein